LAPGILVSDCRIAGLPDCRRIRQTAFSRDGESHVSHRFYAIVWIDHREAEIFHVNATEGTKVVINSHSSTQTLHHESHADGTVHQAVDTNFFARIVSALNHTGGTLLTGPGETKHELERYLRGNRPDLGAHLEELDTVGHPRDQELIALVRDHYQLAA
jgi:stalled ribosome rescue protein Dom34